MIESIIICRHGKLGYSASLRFSDSSFDQDISADNKKTLHNTINYLVRKAQRKAKRGRNA